MKPTEDEKLLMIYYSEAAQQDIDECLQSAAACNKLDQLEADMNAIEQAQSQLELSQNKLPADYGQQLWNQIADRLETPALVPRSSESWLHRLKHMLLMPQYSFASLALVMGLVMLAFYAGRNQTGGTAFDSQLQEQLLAQNIQLHLTQSEIFLTQVNNSSGSFDSQATAQRLLSSNRIFKQALANYDGQFTNQLLQDLEPVLLEYANGASFSNTKQNHGQQPRANWVNDSNSNDLMFQIKTMKQQLAQKNDII